MFRVREVFKISSNNFESTSVILKDDLDPQMIIKMYEYLIPQAFSGNKFTELQVHFASVSEQIMFDFGKACIALCQGHLADHYLYKRRSIEYLQLYAFIASSPEPAKRFEEYFNSALGSDYKRDKGFKKWFSKEAVIFNEKFPSLIQSYNNACKYGTHAGLANQLISQSWKEVPDGFLGRVKYFDMEDVFEKNPLEIALIQLFRTYEDIFLSIFYYKLTPYLFPHNLYATFSSSFHKHLDNYREELKRDYPHLVATKKSEIK